MGTAGSQETREITMCMITTNSVLPAIGSNGPAGLFNAADEPPAVPTCLVEECLSLYPQDHRHLECFRYSSGVLTATVLPHEIDYSTIKVEYYTASQIVLLASQMAYVLGGCLLSDPLFPEATPGMYPVYLKLLRSGQLYYVQLQMKFRRKTGNSLPHEVSMQVRRIVRRNGLYLMLSQLNLARGSGLVDVTLAMSTRRTAP
jgi:hypothetical protein